MSVILFCSSDSDVRTVIFDSVLGTAVRLLFISDSPVRVVATMSKALSGREEIELLVTLNSVRCVKDASQAGQEVKPTAPTLNA